MALQPGTRPAALGPFPERRPPVPEEPRMQPLWGCRDPDPLMPLSLRHISVLMAPSPGGPQTGGLGHCPIIPHPSCPRHLFCSELPTPPSTPEACSPCGPGCLFWQASRVSLSTGMCLQILHRTMQHGPAPALCPQKPARTRQRQAHSTRCGPLGMWVKTARCSPALSCTHTLPHSQTLTPRLSHSHFHIHSHSHTC